MSDSFSEQTSGQSAQANPNNAGPSAKEYTDFEMTDADVDSELAGQANKAAPGGAQQQQPSGESAGHKMGDPITVEAEELKDGDDIDNAEDLATATVSLLEACRENILAPIYQRQIYALIKPEILHSVMTKQRLKKHNIIAEAYTPDEMAALDEIEKVRLYSMGATYGEEKEEKYTEKWRRFYVSMGWEKKLPPWVSLMITVVVTEGFFAFPVLSNWWDSRNKKVEQKKAA